MNKEDKKRLIKLCRRRIRLEIMSRLWATEKIRSVFNREDPYTKKLRTDDEIMKLLYGTDSLVEIGLQTGLLKERPDKTKKREAKKRAKELGDFFDGEFKKNKKRLSKKRPRQHDTETISKKRRTKKTP
jgi:hypothetical protein